jgi:hypothetical protein
VLTNKVARNNQTMTMLSPVSGTNPWGMMLRSASIGLLIGQCSELQDVTIWPETEAGECRTA